MSPFPLKLALPFPIRSKGPQALNRVDSSQLSCFSYLYLIVEHVEEKLENWTPAQNGKCSRVGQGGDTPGALLFALSSCVEK